MITCCKNCVPPIRKINCHSSCTQYQEERKNHERLKQSERKDREFNNFFADEMSVAIKKYYKNKR